MRLFAASDSGTGIRSRSIFDLRHRHHRHTAPARRSRLHQRARIRIAPRHHAVVRSGNRRVISQRGVVLMVRFRYLQLLLSGRQRRLRGIHLRLRCAILCGRVVQFLLRDQSGPSFVGVLPVARIGMQGNTFGLGARYFAMGTLNLFFRVMDGRLRLIHLRDDFRNFQHRQHLALADAVADIDVDVVIYPATLAWNSTFWYGLNWPAIESVVAMVSRLTGATEA